MQKGGQTVSSPSKSDAGEVNEDNIGMSSQFGGYILGQEEFNDKFDKGKYYIKGIRLKLTFIR